MTKTLVRKLMVNWVATLVSVLMLLSMLAMPAMAVVAANSINSSAIINGQVKKADIGVGAVASGRIADSAVTSAKIRNGHVRSADIALKAVLSGRIADGAVTSAKIRNRTITNADIAAGLNADTVDSKHASAFAASGHNHASNIPAGVVVAWTGSIASIPAGWALCDGNNSTPDLTDRFILGADSSLNTTGGASSHSHGDNFSTSSGGSHNHSLHNSGGWAINTNTGSTGMNYAGSHSHTVNGAVSSEATLPPYYKMAYIVKK